MKTFKVLGISCVILFVSVMSCLASSGKSTTLKLAHIYSTDHPWHLGAVKAAEQIKEKTNGRIKVEIYPSGQIGTEAELVEAVMLGSVDIAELGMGQLGTVYSSLNVTEMPYVFRDIDHTRLFQKSDIAAELFEKLRDRYGVSVLASGCWGVRHLTANKKVTSPADLAGFKLRVPEQTVPLAYAKAMGANPTPIAYSEAYLALQQGVVDGLENPMTSIKSMKFYEVQDYINLTGHIVTIVTYAMNNDKLQSLSAEDQKILIDAFDSATVYQNELFKEDDKNLVAFFESEGLTVNKDIDFDAFRKATAPMWNDFSKWWKKDFGADLPNRIQALK